MYTVVCIQLCVYVVNVTSDRVEVWKYVPKVPGIAHSSHFLKCGGVVVGQALGLVVNITY